MAISLVPRRGTPEGVKLQRMWYSFFLPMRGGCYHSQVRWGSSLCALALCTRTEALSWFLKIKNWLIILKNNKGSGVLCVRFFFFSFLCMCVCPQVKRGLISWAASMAINPEDQVEEGEGDDAHHHHHHHHTDEGGGGAA